MGWQWGAGNAINRHLIGTAHESRNKQRAPTTMSSSRDRVEDTYESQNDQRLDELHSKIRTLRGVRSIPPRQLLVSNTLQITTDIHDDVERQNLMLDDTVSVIRISM